MTQVGGQQGQVGFDVEAGSIPAEHGGHGKAVACVVHAGSAPFRARLEPGVADEAGERALNGDVDQPGARRRHEEARRLRPWTALVAQACVGAESVEGAGQQRQLTALVELGVPYDQHPLGPVDVVPVEADQLTDARPGYCQQPDQRLVGGGPQSRGERTGGSHQRGDLSLGVQVGGGPTLRPGQQLGGWHLGGRVEGLHVAGEAAHRAQPVAQIRRMGVVSWQPGPGQRQLGGDGRRASGLQVGDEVLEKTRVALELGAQSPADHDVVVDRLTESAHCSPPGHGRARVRSAVRSTLA
jgi:hypothetical protein